MSTPSTPSDRASDIPDGQALRCDFAPCRSQHVAVTDQIMALLAIRPNDPDVDRSLAALVQALGSILHSSKIALLGLDQTRTRMPRIAVWPDGSEDGSVTFSTDLFPDTWQTAGHRGIRRVSDLASLAADVQPHLHTLVARGVTDLITIPLFDRQTRIGMTIMEFSDANAYRPCGCILASLKGVFEQHLTHWMARQEISRIQNVLRSLSLCNAAVVRAGDEQTMLDEICQILTGPAGYRLAWIGLASHDRDRSVVPVAWSGFEDGYLENIDLTWADVPRGRGPTGTAIRTGVPVATQDILADENFGPWREAARERGYASSCSIPIVSDGATVGAINVYSSHADAFGEEELDLLVDMAATVGYGIAELKLRAQEIENAVRLEALVEAKDQFIAAVSHELRTPLTAMIGLASELEDGLDDFSPEDLRELVHIIAHQGDELAYLIEDLLVAARAELGQVRVQPIGIGLLREANAALSLLPSESGQPPVVSGADVAVLADPARVRQIVRNLITNAWRYGGETIELVVQHRQDRGVLLARDNGSGIPPEQRSLVFEPYHQVSRPTTMPGSIGLGLTVSRMLARLMGGDLEYKYSDGWSEFVLSLPLAD